VHLIEGLLENKSDIQPSTIHADTQGQSAPVFALATLFGFDLMPRIRSLRARITAATNKVESYNGFSHWLAFGNNGVLASNDPAEQEKLIKLNTLLANLVIFHNALDIMDVVRQLVAEGWLITAGPLGAIRHRGRC